MADCLCTHIPTASSITVNSDAVTFNGGATCTGFSSGTLNAFITHISDEVCDIQTTLATLTVDAEDITLTGITAPACVPTTGLTNLAEWLVSVATYLCAVDTALNALTVTDIGGTFNITCLGGSATATLQATVQALITEVCSLTAGQTVSDLLMDGGSLGLPLLMFAKDAVTVTDISGLGVAGVNIDATNYWINAQAVAMPSTNIPLYDSQDNYIFIDKVTQLYDVAPVAIGGATPTTNGDFVMWARTGVGVVNSWTVLIGTSPFDSTLLQDDSISAGKLDAGICTQPLENDGSNIILNIDTDRMAIVGNELTLATGAIDDVTLIDAAAVLAPSIAVSGGKLQVGVEDSVQLDAVTSKVQLVNDSNAPGNNYMYATTSAGVKGWRLMPTIMSESKSIYNETDWITVLPAEILAMHTSPVTIVNNTTINTAVSIEEIDLWIGSGTGYVSANPIEIRYTDGSGEKLTDDIPAAFITAGTIKHYVAKGISGYATENADVVMCVPAADPTTGNTEIQVKVFYKLIDGAI